MKRWIMGRIVIDFHKGNKLHWVGGVIWSICMKSSLMWIFRGSSDRGYLKYSYGLLVFNHLSNMLHHLSNRNNSRHSAIQNSFNLSKFWALLGGILREDS